MRRVLLLAVATLALAAGPAGAGPNLVIGAAENAVVSADEATVAAQLGLATAAGLDAIRVAVPWSPGQTAPDPSALAAYSTTARQASLGGIRLYFEVYPASRDAVPNDETRRAEFSEYLRGLALALPQVRDYVIGSQVNSSAFWPQDARAAGDYVALLASAYDALKGVDPGIQVIGGALNAQAAPGTYVLALGKAYRASGRAAPIMDAFAIQPSNASSGQPPTLVHPSGETTIADYARLVANLKRAFANTIQPGATLPIVYDGYGVQTEVPRGEGGPLHRHRERRRPRERPGGLLPAGAAAGRVPAERRRAALPAHGRRARPDRLAVRPLLPRPDAEERLRRRPRPRSRACAAARPAAPARSPRPRRRARPGRPTRPCSPSTRRGTATIACTSDCYYVAVLERDTDGAPVAARQGRVLPGATQVVSFADRQAGRRQLPRRRPRRGTPGPERVGRRRERPVPLG